MPTVKVTVAVDTQDIEDTLRWMRGEGIDNDATHRWLTAYVETEGEQHELIFRAMSPSLQWCVNEYEERGPDALRAVLRQASIHSHPEKESDHGQ